MSELKDNNNSHPSVLRVRCWWPPISTQGFRSVRTLVRESVALAAFKTGQRLTKDTSIMEEEGVALGL